jgi:hypothetical protein
MIKGENTPLQELEIVTPCGDVENIGFGNPNMTKIT